jgi:hypothetical protein
MKTKLARISLAAGTLWFLLGWFVLGDAPEWFLISAAFGGVAAVLGSRRVRPLGVALLLLSTASAFLEYQAQQRRRDRVREVGQRLVAAGSAWNSRADVPLLAATRTVSVKALGLLFRRIRTATSHALGRRRRRRRGLDTLRLAKPSSAATLSP